MKTIKLVLITMVATILAATAQARVDREDRVLVVVSELQLHGPQSLRPLYEVIEDLTSGTTGLILGDDYRQILHLRGSRATVANFKATLQALSRDSRIKAIDVIFSLHGSTDAVAFREGRVTMSSLLSQMTTPSANMSVGQIETMKRKLRMIYNLSCFGRSHNKAFVAMGFDASVGSLGINANSEVEFPSVLSQWSVNFKFVDSFAVTNSDFAIAAADTPVQLAGISASSKKFFLGRSQITISSDPN